MPLSKRRGLRRTPMRDGSGGGWRKSPTHSTGTARQGRWLRSRQPPPPKATSSPELLVDPLAVRAHRRPRLGGLRHRKYLAEQRDDVRPHDGAFGDLVL